MGRGGPSTFGRTSDYSNKGRLRSLQCPESLIFRSAPCFLRIYRQRVSEMAILLKSDKIRKPLSTGPGYLRSCVRGEFAVLIDLNGSSISRGIATYLIFLFSPAPASWNS